MKKFVVLLILFLVTFSIYSQNEVNSPIDTLRKDALNVYMDASSYLKNEIPFINYVRDRKVADLIIIDAYQRTGSGGYEYTYFIEGQFEYSGMMDTLKFTTSPDETLEQRRSKEVKTLKMGLMRYLIKTPLAEYINIRFSEPITEEVSSDKWNSWVFRTRISASLNGQKSNNRRSITSSFSASKVTSEWKINSSFYYNNSLSKYDYGDIKASDTRKSSSADLLVVKSLNDHWSAGGYADINNSTFSNYDLGVNMSPAIEYDIFPYSESTRRQFRILYVVGLDYNNYTDTTQFFKTEETLWSHSIQTAYSTIQKWGNISVSATWSNYLHDFSLNNLSLYGYVSLKVAKGFSVSLTSQYSFIHDQVSLRKGNASIEDVLLNRQELSTTYSYFTSFGVTYTFGSIYNNAVNPRFTGH